MLIIKCIKTKEEKSFACGCYGARGNDESSC